MFVHTQKRRLSNETKSTDIWVGTHFNVIRKIGQGSFGVIYEGVNGLNGQRVAIKFEKRTSNLLLLPDEFRAYRILAGQLGIPSVYYFGREGQFNVLVLDLLGPNLDDLFHRYSKQFTIKTVAMLAIRLIDRFQCIHEHNLVYRDVKPENILVGPDNKIYVIDFGMTKMYRDPDTKSHIPYGENRSPTGTARYMSINTHLGREQSRRDDMEALGYVLVYFLRGGLPWQGLIAASIEQKYEKIAKKKKNIPINDLCHGCPEEMVTYMQHVRSLAFDQMPDYAFLRQLFVNMLDMLGETDDGVFDWMEIQETKPQWLAPGVARGGKHSIKSKKSLFGFHKHDDDGTKKGFWSTFTSAQYFVPTVKKLNYQGCVLLDEAESVVYLQESYEPSVSKSNTENKEKGEPKADERDMAHEW